ncbi:MAG TPA: 1-deoxy-D-xylulose-5-phosphate synthase [Verrucomicrobiales bacterium]|nr:1-deoxy-D-xylulose-5-phosphate synthase [Verrucomicrobiales bacterium]
MPTVKAPNRYLDMVDNPAHVKKLTLKQLERLAEELREELINGLCTHGGHLGPNLGVVELTLAMHKVFETPNDKFVWDVSHQSYVHKLLTGRKDRFRTIRTTEGLNGFALRTESEHDCYGAGHAGTALSAALGIAAARDRQGGNENVICVFGDAALTNGVSFEALNNIAHTTKRFIGILNDNEWSIAKNVGAISNYLNKLITNPGYNRITRDLQAFLAKVPTGKLALRLGLKGQEALKGTVTQAVLQHNEETLDPDGRGGFGSSLVFEEFGIRYLGPIDGHDLPLLLETLEFAKTCDQPIVIHVITKKGKGFSAALEHPEKFHGTGPFNPNTGESLPPKNDTPPKYQDVFGQTMIKLCRKDNSVVGITAAMPSGTGLGALEKAMPKHYFDVGIAEEHAVLFAAGMATMGCRPVCAIYSTFLQRAYDMIIHDVALQKLPVTFCMDRAGLSANDGPTHHGLFDIAYLNCIPGVIAMAPANEDELADMMFTATHQDLPAFIRYPRGNGEGVTLKEQPGLIDIGKAEVLKNFSSNGQPKVVFLVLGPMRAIADEAIAELGADNIDAAVINPRFTKPIDTGTTEFFAQAAEVIVTIEDHALKGGYGSIVRNHLADTSITTPVVRIGWPDEFIEHASSVSYLRNKYGLTGIKTAELIRTTLDRATCAATKPNQALGQTGGKSSTL